MDTKKIILASILTASLISCTPTQQQGAGLGVLGGGVLGALTGNGSQSVVKGAAVGAAVGVGLAALKESQNRGYNHNQSNHYDQQRSNYDQQRSQSSRYPYAERTNNRYQVISPYSPYNVVDVRGFSSGELVRDPSTNQIFRVP
jgi:hypothetical protein